ncbi:MAG: hypothetical protein OSA40_01570 [Phycisphaerales bacterium]|jgi:hypothetical protein|nr:hypothetical protein [Phycisphaerales bacterium]
MTRTHSRMPHGARRPGFALLDVVIAGVILAIGLATIFSITSKSLALQRDGEVRVMAAGMLDNLLSEVLLEGPADYPNLHSSSGRGEFPYEEFDFQVRISDPGVGEPYRVLATVTHETGRSFVCETLIAGKLGEEPDPIRQPQEPIDREARYEEAFDR